MPTPFIKAPEPDWTPGENLRFLAELLRACVLQCGTLQHRSGLKPAFAESINRIAKKLEYCEKEATAGRLKPGTEADAADYFDNEGSILWEVANETRKLTDRRVGLALLYAYNAGAVVEVADAPA